MSLYGIIGLTLISILAIPFSLSYGTGIQTQSYPILSSLVDMPLMNTIAQISATFIAITAGFYTTKIISIISEKSRLEGKIKELLTEKSALTTDLNSLQTKIDSFEEKESEEVIELFVKALLADTKLPSYKIDTVDDLISIFEEFVEQKPLARQEKILRDKASNIIEKVLEVKKKLKETNTRLAVYPVAIGDERIVDAISNQNEVGRYNNLLDRRVEY